MVCEMCAAIDGSSVPFDFSGVSFISQKFFVLVCLQNMFFYLRWVVFTEHAADFNYADG